jgi:hypothetical protein
MAKKSINIRAGFDLKAFSTSQQNLIRKLQASGEKMKSVGRSMSMSLTAPIVGLGAVATKTFATFEQSMAKVKAISGATGSAFKDLESTARQLGMTTRFSASEVAELMLNYSKLGFSASEIEKITGATLNLALATGEDLAQSATIAGGTLRGFALEADQMTRVTDVMAKSFSSSALDLEKFQNAMPKVSAVASSLGITLEETTAMLGVLANKNIRATTSGTSLKNIFLITRKEGMSFKDAMDKINQSIDPPTTAMQMFGKENATVALALSQSGDAISQMTAKLEDAGGAAEAMAKIMDDTLEGSMFRLQSAVSEMGISIGEKLAPHIIKVTNFLAKLAEGFSQLNPETQQIIIQLAATAAAIGPLIYAFGALKLAMAFLVAHPAVLVAIALTSALAALNIAASETNKIFDNVKTATEAMQTAYDELGAAVDNLNRLKNQGLKASKDEIKLAIQNAKAKLKQAEAYFKLNMQRRKELALQKKESLQQALKATRQVGKQGEFIGAELAQTKQIEANILAVDEKLAKLTEQSFSAKDGIKELEAQLKQIENLKPTKNTFLETTTGETKSTAIAIQAPSKKGIENVTSQISEMANKAIEPVQIKIEPLSNQELGIVTTAEKIGKNAGEALSNGLQQLATQGAVMLGEFLGDALTGDADAKEFGKGLLNAVGGFMKQFGEAMIAIGIAESAIAKSIALGPAGAGLAIAGGVALIAAGAALSNLSKKGIDMNAGGASPSPTGGGMRGMVMQPISLETKISGRDLILVQNREKGFTR